MTLVIIVANAYNTVDLNITSGGKTRHMILKVPANFEKNRPMLICCHGASQSAAYMTDPKGNFANFEAIVDAEQFLAVYPDGEGNMWDISGTKDTQFMIDIINEMKKRYSIDENRVYLSGFSMGGMFTYHAMNKLSDKIAAFAPLSGYPMNGPNAASPRPVPFIHVHGSGDDVCTFSPVQSHINAWVSHNKCVATPVQEKPKSGPANTTSYLNRYKAGEGGVEVALLVNPGKGHWVSNDTNFSLTYREVWDFVSRYSFIDGPKVLSVTPENDSFDMTPSRDRQFVFTVDKPVDCSKVILNMSDGKNAITFKVQESGFSQTLTFDMDESKTPKDTEYRMQLRNLVGEDGSNTTIGGVYYYTYGVVDTGEKMKVDTLLTSDWASMQSTIDEGIPYGWHRKNSTDGGNSDEKTSGMAKTGGARLKYFTKGGDFDAGFYFSARDFSKCLFTYGTTNHYNLLLSRGRFILSFRSIYWNDGAENNSVEFTTSILSSTETIASSQYKSQGCMLENENQKVMGSKLHEMEFEVTPPMSSNHKIQFGITAGWDGVIIGPPTLMRRPSSAELYKGEFLRTVAKAQEMIDNVGTGYNTQIASLNDVVQKHKGLVSISPSAYNAARKEIEDALNIATGVHDAMLVARKSLSYFDMAGRKISHIHAPGVYLYNGKKFVVK